MFRNSRGIYYPVYQHCKKCVFACKYTGTHKNIFMNTTHSVQCILSCSTFQICQIQKSFYVKLKVHSFIVIISLSGSCFFSQKPIRQSWSLCAGEQDYVNRRKQVVLESLNSLKISCTEVRRKWLSEHFCLSIGLFFVFFHVSSTKSQQNNLKALHVVSLKRYRIM